MPTSVTSEYGRNQPENNAHLCDLTMERGHYYMCYTYVTVVVRNAANLAHKLPKASRTTFTNNDFL
jgi:hypothetical protein